MTSTSAAPPVADATAETQLTIALAQHGEPVAPSLLRLYSGRMTPSHFGDPAKELDSLLHAAGVSDLGWRGKILVTGSDRLRWLNGMVSNTVQALPEGQGNYSFLLSVQGRIQGDCYVYRRANDLLLDTGADQLAPVLSHLDHFVVMDDVELADVSQKWSALSLTGPGASRVLEALGVAALPTGLPNAIAGPAQVGEVACMLIALPQVVVPRYELWFAAEDVLAVWETVQAAGAHPYGLQATEALRVLEGTPLYGVDLNDRDLPQETAQTRALNFSKGCYLGQEIVERIRSRGKVNRQFRQFTLQGATTGNLPLELRSGDQPVGRITSTASLASAGIPETLALGFIRLEIVERDAEIAFDGGTAKALAAAPQVPGIVSSAK